MDQGIWHHHWHMRRHDAEFPNIAFLPTCHHGLLVGRRHLWPPWWEWTTSRRVVHPITLLCDAKTFGPTCYQGGHETTMSKETNKYLALNRSPKPKCEVIGPHHRVKGLSNVNLDQKHRKLMHMQCLVSHMLHSQVIMNALSADKVEWSPSWTIAS
jgi:hypothetical protein